MEKVEQFIREHTRNWSNKWYDDLSQGYEPWLTPNNARKVAEIAREETIKEVCEWLDNHTMLSEKWYIEDLKKNLEDKV